MTDLDGMLSKFDLKYEDLTAIERESLLQRIEQANKQTLTIEGMKDVIAQMKRGVERELINEPEFTRIFIFRVPNRKQILLKARLQNLMLLDEIFFNTRKNLAEVEQALKNLKP